MKDETHQLENSNETLFLVTNVRSLQREAKSTFSKTPQVNPTLSSENESSKTIVQKRSQRESKLRAKTAMSKPEDNFRSESDTENETNVTKGNQENVEKEPIKFGPRKYGCPICSKIMQTTTEIKRHILIHTGEKPFSCNECGKAYNQKSTLKRHILIHTGEKPFSCNICAKAFTQKTELQLHFKNHHM